MARSLPLAALLLCCLFSPATAQQENDQVKWGYVSSSAFNWDVYAAIEKGFMGQQRLTIQKNMLDNASQALQALATGAVDILSSNAELAIVAIDKGANLAIVGNETAKLGWALMTRPEIRSYEDLKGKTLGVPQLNDASTLTLMLLLEKHGIPRTQYDTLQLGGVPNRYAALVKGAVQGTVLPPPAEFKAASEGMRRMGSVSEAFEGPSVVFVARREWLQANEAIAVRFLRGALRGANWLYDPANRNDAVAVLSRSIRSTESDGQKTYDLCIQQEKMIAVDGELPPQHIQNYLDIKKIKGPPSRFMDLTYLAKARAR